MLYKLYSEDINTEWIENRLYILSNFLILIFKLKTAPEDKTVSRAFRILELKFTKLYVVIL